MIAFVLGQAASATPSRVAVATGELSRSAGEMKATPLSMVLIWILLAGCATSPARQIAELPDYHTTQEYNQMGEAFALIGNISQQNLQNGMTPQEVENLMGKPEMRDKRSDRVEIWTYLVSISGTWCYILAFLDGKLEYFGNANPQWMGDDDYILPGAERLLQVMREDRIRAIEE